ncbi:unnamed protein product [Amaranthus hypochondriacus]
MKTLKPHYHCTLSPASLSSPIFSKPNPNFSNYSLNFRVFNLNHVSYSSKVSSLSTKPSSSSSLTVYEAGSSGFRGLFWNSEVMEEVLEKVVYRCRFVTFLGVFGSLFGSLLCFIKGCAIVAESFSEHFVKSGNVIPLLIEAMEVYLLGTVMLVFGMGLYELFVSNLDIAKSLPDAKDPHRSNFFGLFAMMERPRWLEIKTVNELKTKVGHVIVMLLLIGLFDNCKKAAISTPSDLLCFSASVLLCSGCLYLLSKLNGSH